MKKFITAVLCLIAAFVQAQDPQFSQYYQSPLYLNPGFTGITNQQRATLVHRIQWPSLPKAFSTTALSYDIWVDELRSGFGFLLTNDKIGSASWQNTVVGLSYSYKIRLTDKLVFSPGLNFSYGSSGLDATKLQLGDGLEFNGNSLDPYLAQLGTTQYFDFGAGFVLYNKDLFFGAAFSHLNTPNLSILNTENRLPMKMVFHGGGRITLNGGIRTVAKPSYLTPSFIYRVQGLISQFDVGINYHVDPVSLGVWYRGKPWETTVNKSLQQDAMVFTMGLYLKDISIGYSYDFSLSGLSTATGGAHEISIVYEFAAKPIHQGVKKRNRLIPCPSFNSKAGFWN
jgi:type IX secretion system PorP/SprF family membrane protein